MYRILKEVQVGTETGAGVYMLDSLGRLLMIEDLGDAIDMANP